MYIQEKVTWDAGVESKLALLKTLGVDCISVPLPEGPRASAGVDLSSPESVSAFLAKAKSTVKSYGMELRTLMMMDGFDEIKRGTEGRERKMEMLLNVIQAMGAAGIPILSYNLKLLHSKDLRTQPTTGRGAAKYVSFDYDEFLKKPKSHVDTPVSEEKMWDNITYFLKAAVPAAEKAGVRLALHPDDPPVPAGTPALAGVAHIVSTFEQFHRIFNIVPSRANGMLFCQGCVKEMQGVNIYDAIRHMGSIDKIVMVHFRNVRGSFPRFQETFVDDGDVDMYQAMCTYRDVGFKGPFALDHSPNFPGSEVANQAFVIGYLRALIQSVYR